jgi:hypothetical protein
MPEPNSGCLLWCGPVNEQGYGRLYIGKRATRANRWAWKQRHGPIPKGQHVLHKCDVTYCVNVDHFFLGTNAENISDKMRKGRYRCLRGERHPNSKLNENAVRHIRSKVESAACYASLYGVTPELVWMVQGRKIWKHVK